MRSLSITATDSEHFVDLTTKPSFRNQVSLGLWQGKRAYKKAYPEREYWQAELAMLQLFTDHHLIATPRIYHVDEDALSIVMSEVSGKSLETVQPEQISGLASVLAVFHREQQLRSIARLDVGQRLGLYEYNIMNATCLSEQERRQAKRALGILTGELVPVAEEANDLVHGDFNVGNVLFDAASNRFGLIDFERSFVGIGLMDVAKGAWRILNNQKDSVDLFLRAYFGRAPNRTERQLFLLIQAYEYLGALSYFALEGHANGYPYKDQAFEQLKQCLSQF